MCPHMTEEVTKGHAENYLLRTSAIYKLYHLLNKKTKQTKLQWEVILIEIFHAYWISVAKIEEKDQTRLKQTDF